MTGSRDLPARWTAVAVAALCVVAWLGNAAHVAVAPHGHHHAVFEHEHEHEHEHEQERLLEHSEPAPGRHPGDGHGPGVEPHPDPNGHDLEDHRLADALRVQQVPLVALPDLEAAPGAVVTTPAGRQPRPPALDADPPDPAPPSGALRLRAPPVG